MKNLQSFNTYNIDIKLNLLIRECSLINENVLTNILGSFTTLKKSITSKEDAQNLLSLVSNKITSLDSNVRKKLLKYVVAICIGYFSIGQIQSFFKDDFVKQEIVQVQEDTKFSPLKMHLSIEGLEHIKSHEKLKIVAYTLGDGKVTVGYGHAENIEKSKIKKGQKISVKLANKLLKKDIHTAEQGVKRIFKEWQEQGIDIKLTQEQFDVLVSLAFNMGISGLRQTDFIQEVKKGNIEEAGKLIKKTGINPDFEEGLSARREIESDTFLRTS